MTLHNRETIVAGRQQVAHDLTLAGEALFGHDWKGPLAARLMIRPSTLGDMSTGRSRIPPSLWNEIAGLIQERQHILHVMGATARRHADETPHRLYRAAGGLEFKLMPDAHGRWPTLHHNGSGNGEWTALADDERRLPDTAGMFYLQFEGVRALPSNVMGRAVVHYPRNFTPKS